MFTVQRRNQFQLLRILRNKKEKMMGKIESINTVDRPASMALMAAIEDSIEDIAPGKMTAIEVIGVLDVVSKRFFEDKLSLIKVAIEDAGL